MKVTHPSQYQTTIVPTDPTELQLAPPFEAIDTFTRRSGPTLVANSDTSLHIVSQDFMLLSNTLACKVMTSPFTLALNLLIRGKYA